MKKQVYIVLSLLLGLIAFNSCTHGTNGNNDNNDSIKIELIDSIEVPSINEIVGTVGDGTTMHVLEIIKDNGDTLYVVCPDRPLAEGSVEIGDKVDVIYNTDENGENHIMTSINITALQHLWSQNDEDGQPQNLEIGENGRVTTYDMDVDYSAWSLADGKLLLHSPKKIGSEEAAMTDTFEIMELSDEHLVLMHGNYVTSFTREN